MSESESTSLTFQEYLDGIEELKNTNGWKVARKIEHLGISFYIFKANHDELTQCIEQFKLPISLALFWGDDNAEKMDQFLKNVTRLLHNFVAGAKTLVEHTRIIAREMYEGTELWDEYEAQIGQRFTSVAHVQFVHKLRDYILHRDLPVTSATLTSVVFSPLQIDIKKLRAWDGWTGLSRQYVNSANDQEKIEDIVQAYTNSIISFHDWFHNRQLEFYKETFEEAEKLRQRLVNSSWHLK